MSEKIAYLFPGQGSQFIGMGRDLAESFPAAKEIFEQVDELCGRSISRRHGGESCLSDGLGCLGHGTSCVRRAQPG